MNRLKECRERAGLSQKYIALTLGIAPPSVSNWERGKTLPSNANLARLASLYNVSIDYLLGRDEPPRPASLLGREESPQPTADDDELRAQILSRINGLSDPALARTLDFLNGLLAGQETAAGKATDLGRASKSNPESHS